MAKIKANSLILHRVLSNAYQLAQITHTSRLLAVLGSYMGFESKKESLAVVSPGARIGWGMLS